MAKGAKVRQLPRPKSSGLGLQPTSSQPSARASVQWTPGTLKQVLRRADSGDISLVADLCDQIVADDRFGALLGQLADDVIGCDLTFEKTLRVIVGEAEKSKELSRDWQFGYDDEELKSLIIWTMLTGIGFAKHETWIETEGGRIVPQLKWWHPTHFSYRSRDNTLPLLNGDLRNHCWHVRLPGTDAWAPISPGDGTWVILTHRSDYRPWASGMWRALSVWWLLKQYAMLDSGSHTEKAAKSVVTSTVDSTDAERKELAQYVYDAGKDPVFVLPNGFKLDLLEVRANLDTLYHSQIRLANESAALTILGQNLSTTVEGGSYAAAKEHGNKESRRVRNAAQMLSTGLQAQSLAWWAEFNFGDRELAPYPHWNTAPPSDYAAKAAVFSTAATALLTLKTAGYEVEEDFLEEELGLKLRKTKALIAREQAEPGDTDGDGVPHNEPGNATKPDDEESPEPKGGKAPKAAPPRARPPRPKQASLAAQTSFLASGDAPEEAKGFIRGQLYVDELSDKSTALAADDLSGFLDRILAAIDGAEDYEQVRYRVIKAFQGEADPDRLAYIVERAILLADLAGRYAVLEDAPSDE